MGFAPYSIIASCSLNFQFIEHDSGSKPSDFDCLFYFGLFFPGIQKLQRVEIGICGGHQVFSFRPEICKYQHILFEAQIIKTAHKRIECSVVDRVCTVNIRIFLRIIKEWTVDQPILVASVFICMLCNKFDRSVRGIFFEKILLNSTRIIQEYIQRVRKCDRLRHTLTLHARGLK